MEMAANLSADEKKSKGLLTDNDEEQKSINDDDKIADTTDLVMGTTMSRTNTQHTIVDLSKVTDILSDNQEPEQIEKAVISGSNVPLSTANDENLDSLINPQNAEKLTPDAEKSEDIMTSSVEAEESTSLLDKQTVARSDDENEKLMAAGDPTDKVFIENETLGDVNAYAKKAAIMAIGRKPTQLSFIANAYVIQINSSKESHMRALPSEKFWRRNQRRVSSMPTLEEGQLAKQ
jgi:hypothetical protein